VTGEHNGLVGQREQLVVDGAEEHRSVAAGQVGASNGAREKRVACQQQVLFGEVEADAALGMAGGMKDATGEGWRSVADGPDGDELTLVEGIVGRANLGRLHSQPPGLDGHHFDQRQVVLVVENRRASERL